MSTAAHRYEKVKISGLNSKMSYSICLKVDESEVFLLPLVHHFNANDCFRVCCMM